MEVQGAKRVERKAMEELLVETSGNGKSDAQTEESIQNEARNLSPPQIKEPKQRTGMEGICCTANPPGCRYGFCKKKGVKLET